MVASRGTQRKPRRRRGRRRRRGVSEREEKGVWRSLGDVLCSGGERGLEQGATAAIVSEGGRAGGRGREGGRGAMMALDDEISWL